LPSHHPKTSAKRQILGAGKICLFASKNNSAVAGVGAGTPATIYLSYPEKEQGKKDVYLLAKLISTPSFI